MGATLPVEIVTIGTELLLGFTVDTNSAHIGRSLANIGVRVARRTAVGDTPDEIREAVDAALTRTGMVITTGGLGPTRDDISKHAIAELLGTPLEFNEAVWQELVARWQRLGRTIAESNRSQAMVPAGGTVLPNRWGTAPGLWLEGPRGVVILLPGVPTEMRNLLEHEVMPRLATRGGRGVIRSRMLRTAGIPESVLGEKVGDLEESFAPLSLAYLPDVAGVDLRLTAWNLDRDEADTRLEAAAAALRERVGAWIYGEGDDDLAAVVLHELAAREEHLAVAESCTGGMLGARLTAISGSSASFRGGVVAYADGAKAMMLGVPPADIAKHGAVSAPVAEAMARGAADQLGADVAVAITGIAGPTGGTEEKPVGTVWFGFSCRGVVDSARVIFPGTRDEIRARAVQAALVGVLRRVRGEAVPAGGTTI